MPNTGMNKEGSVDAPHRSMAQHRSLPTGVGNGKPGGPVVQQVALRGTLKQHFRRMRPWMMSVVLLATVVMVLWISRKPLYYASSIVVRSERPVITAEPVETELRTTSKGRSWLDHAATSTAMADHLLSLFDPSARYGIDTTDPLHQELVTEKLLRNIDVIALDDKSAMITVRDPDRAMAAAMANEIQAELQRMVERRAVAELERSIAFQERILQHSATIFEQRTRELSGLVDLVNRAPTADGKTTKELTEASIQLTKLIAQLSLENADLVRTLRSQEISLAMSRSENLPEIILMRRAILDTRTSRDQELLLTVLLTPLVAAFLSLLVAALWFKHGHEWSDYLNEPHPLDRIRTNGHSPVLDDKTLVR